MGLSRGRARTKQWPSQGRVGAELGPSQCRTELMPEWGWNRYWPELKKSQNGPGLTRGQVEAKPWPSWGWAGAKQGLSQGQNKVETDWAWAEPGLSQGPARVEPGLSPGQAGTESGLGRGWSRTGPGPNRGWAEPGRRWGWAEADNYFSNSLCLDDL